VVAKELNSRGYRPNGRPPQKRHTVYTYSRRRDKDKLWLVLILLGLLLATVFLFGILYRDLTKEPEVTPVSSAGYCFRTTAAPDESSAIPSIDRASAIGIWAYEVNSTNAILINNTTSEILYVKDAYEIIYPASVTKIMTALVAIEQIGDMSREITLSDTMFKYIEEQNASVAGFYPNETVTALDMLYGLLLPSGADAAIGLAMEIAGDEASFAVLMNQKAEEIGMKNTHFVNATGLHDDDHYSTVYDLALMLRHALKDPLFRRISSTESYTTSSTKAHPGGLVLKNTLFQNLKASGRNNNYITGGKTGYTLEANQCLASYAEKESNTYLLVTVGAGEGQKKKQLHVVDALNVYDQYAK